jgi:hypothetical protein
LASVWFFNGLEIIGSNPWIDMANNVWLRCGFLQAFPCQSGRVKVGVKVGVSLSYL